MNYTCPEGGIISTDSDFENNQEHCTVWTDNSGKDHCECWECGKEWIQWNEIKLSLSQIDFILRACELKEHIIDFSLDGNEFIETYGETQEDYADEINNLRNKLK